MIFDLLIVGAGPVGATLACAAPRLSVGLIGQEQAGVPGEAFDSRVYALSPGNVAFLRQLNVWQAIPEDRLSAVHGMRVYGDDDRALIQFDAYRTGVSALAWIAEHGALQNALWQALRMADNIDVRVPALCERLRCEEDRVVVTLRDGPALAARLVVGADGADSFVRGEAGLVPSERSYGQAALVANFACERPHRNLAWQWFQGGPVLALLPLPGAHVSMVWSLPAEEAERLSALDHAALCAQVEAASRGVVGGLSVVTAPRYYPLRRLRTVPSTASRIALVGDAAHVIHPLAGQGLNLGLQDARVLSEVLGGREPVRDVGDRRLLRRYERARAEPVVAMDLAVDGLFALFASANPVASRLRNAGLGWVERLPILKNLLVRQAMR